MLKLLVYIIVNHQIGFLRNIFVSFIQLNLYLNQIQRGTIQTNTAKYSSIECNSMQ